jgi:predicted dehydrogenase
VHYCPLHLRIRGDRETRLVGQVQEVHFPFLSVVTRVIRNNSAGPIIEQGTHFCDLSRYFGGEVDLSTVSAHSLEWDESAGHLSKIPIDESILAPENRIPRVTAATWYITIIMSLKLDCASLWLILRRKYSSGAVGSLTHLVSLQGTNYSCELEVHADGYALK